MGKSMISSKVKNLIPYTPGEQLAGGFIKLNTNENPHPPSSKVKAVLDNFEYEKLRLYPDPSSTVLTEAIAEFENVKPENIFLGNGSDEVLSFAFLALFEKSVAFADITYSFYPVYCDFYDLKQVLVPLKKDFVADLKDYEKVDAGGIIICNPNAPTSLITKNDDILNLVKKVKCNVLVDEAYIDFALDNKSLAPESINHNNLLVVKTFSKSYSLAGLRCGYAVGNAELINALNTVKNCFNSYTINMFTQKIALEAIKDRQHFDSCVSKIISQRERCILKLQEAGHFVLNSDANFLFVKHKTLSGRQVYEKLKSQKILVRYFDKDKLKEFTRVTIGTKEQMDAFTNEFLAL